MIDYCNRCCEFNCLEDGENSRLVYSVDWEHIALINNSIYQCLIEGGYIDDETKKELEEKRKCRLTFKDIP